METTYSSDSASMPQPTTSLHMTPSNPNLHDTNLVSFPFETENKEDDDNNETKTIDGISFHIHKEIKDSFIVKNIRFTDNEKEHHYTERLKYLDLEKFKDYFTKADLQLKHIFGDYKLTSFDKNTSERLILIATL